MGFSLHERGFRDGFWGREPRESDPVYFDGYHAGLRDGDRTRPLARSTAGIAESASSATPGLVSDSSGVTGSGEASLTSDTPAETSMKRPDSCSACMFARAATPIDVDYGDKSTEGLMGVFTCRRRAPVARPKRREAWWPIVSDDDWCGDGRSVDEQVAQ